MNSIQTYKNTVFKSHKEMHDAFFQLTKNLWLNKDHNDLILESDDLKDIFDLQKFLLQEVIQIHKLEKEIPDSKKEIINSQLKVNLLKNKLNGIYSHHNIYFMDVSGDCYFVGDIHSDAFILNNILKASCFFENIHQEKDFRMVFLGDYVDRGKNHLRTIETLLLLKYLFPKNIYLLMGNHDIGHIENGQITLYLRKVEDDMDYFYYFIQHLHEHKSAFTDELLNLYLEFMNHLNVAAYIASDQNTIMAVHGGIPRPDENDAFDYIKGHHQMTDQTKDYMDFRIRDCIIWSDPSIQDKKPTLENKRFKFYENQLTNYHDTFGFDTLVRGHQVIEDGCLPMFDHKLYTVFSTGQILEDEKNINHLTAYDFVLPKILFYQSKKGLPMTIIDLNK